MSATPTKKVILVTGGSRGIGLAAVRFLLHGTKTIPACNVVSLSRSVPAELQALAKEHTSLAIVQGDVTTSKSNEEMRDEALKRWGRIDGLLLNAGVIDHMRCADLVRCSTLTHRRPLSDCCMSSTLTQYPLPRASV